MKIKRIALVVLGTVIFSGLLLVYANTTISAESVSYLSNSAEKLPTCKTALLLGTSRLLKRGSKNPYFFYRIEAAVELFRSGKVKYIIISGDNSIESYNEPQDMKNELLAKGIPDTCVILDYAGFRTLDSVVRARDIFGQESFIVVSQQFHNERAVYIARRMGINAYAFNAKDVPDSFGYKTRLREYFARIKVFVDLWFGVEPRFLGEKVRVGS